MPLSEAEELELLELEEAEYQASKNVPRGTPESWGKTLGRGALEALPMAGAVGGGVLGTAAGPVGTVSGGGLGYGIGRQLERLGKEYLLDEKMPDQTPLDVAKDVGEGALFEMGAGIAGKLPGLISSAKTAAKELIPPTAFEAMAKPGRQGWEQLSDMARAKNPGVMGNTLRTAKSVVKGLVDRGAGAVTGSAVGGAVGGREGADAGLLGGLIFGKKLPRGLIKAAPVKSFIKAGEGLATSGRVALDTLKKADPKSLEALIRFSAQRGLLE